MVKSTQAHPVISLKQETTVLYERSLFAKRRAAAIETKARTTSTDLKQLDMASVVKQMRALVEFAA